MSTPLTINEGSDGQASPPCENERTKRIPQFMAGFTVNLTGVIAGTVIGWTSPMLPLLLGPNSPIPITETESSWIASLMPLAASFGPFLAGFLLLKFGPKISILLSAVPTTISWVMLAAGRKVEIIYAARFLAGFAAGWVFTLVPIYCGEIADKSVRGAVLSLTQMFIVFGLLYDYCIGPYIPYMWLQIGAVFIPVAFVLLFSFMPDSPYYLLSNGHFDKAEKSLRWLRGKSACGVAAEMEEIQESVEKAKKEKGRLKDIFATKGTIRAFILSLGLLAFQQFSGINVVLFFGQTIFQKTNGSLEPEESTIIIGCIMLLASATTPLFVDRKGRKPLLLVSAIGMAISQAVLGLCFYLDYKQVDTSSINFLPVTALVIFIIVYCLGFGPLPWAVLGEMFPSNIKSLASTLSASFCWILGFIVTRFFNDIVHLLGTHYTFWIFSGCCVIAAFFVFYLLPETKGKTFTEIQKLLDSSS